MSIKDELELLSPPWDTILETLQVIGMSQPQLANILGIGTKRLEGIISGEVPIDLDIANRLEATLSIPAQFWMNRDRNYRYKKEIIEAEQRGFESRQGEVTQLMEPSY